MNGLVGLAGLMRQKPAVVLVSAKEREMDLPMLRVALHVGGLKLALLTLLPERLVRDQRAGEVEVHL